MMNRKLNVGDWIVLKDEFKDILCCFHKNPMKIIKIKEDFYYKFRLFIEKSQNTNQHKDNEILIKYVEYYPMREKKLERILEEDE